MDKTLDLDELERVAREAASAAETEGRWVVLEDDGDVGVVRAASDDVWIARTGAAGYPAPTARAAHIATFDPPTILTLIAAARPAVVSDEVVEAMCRAHSASHRQSDDWDRFGPRTQAEHKAAMRAALALLPGGVPDREAIARVIDPEAFSTNTAGTRKRRQSALAKADAIIAMLSASPEVK